MRCGRGVPRPHSTGIRFLGLVRDQELEQRRPGRAACRVDRNSYHCLFLTKCLATDSNARSYLAELKSFTLAHRT